MESTIEYRQASNAILPISKLDDDVLSHIFMFNAHLDFFYVHIPSTTVRRTSQVYRRWRNLLLNYPLIWGASLDFGDPKAWIDVILARAGDAPLNLVVPSLSRRLLGPYDRGRSPRNLNHLSEIQLQDRFSIHTMGANSEDELNFALSLLPRCRKIVISVLSSPQIALLSKKASLIAGSNLQEFSLSVNPFHDRFLWYSSEALRTPQLKRLELIGSGTNLLSPSFRGLTYLSVVDQLNWHGMPLQADAWLTVLRRLPLLEELSLRKFFKKQTSISDDASQDKTTAPISLSHLRSLTLDGHCVACHEILSAIRLPASCTLRIAYSKIDFTIHPVASFMSELYEKVQSNVKHTKVRSLLRTSMSERFFGINSTSGGDVDRTRPISIIFTLIGVSNIEMMLPELVKLLLVLSSGLKHLEFDISPGYSASPSVARRLLEPFHQVNALHFCEVHTLSTITAIHREPQADLRIRPLILPQLSEISMNRVAFYDDENVEDCVDLLQRRLEINAPIKRIVLQNCRGNVETLVAKLRNIDVEFEELEQVKFI